MKRERVNNILRAAAIIANVDDVTSAFSKSAEIKNRDYIFGMGE